MRKASFFLNSILADDLVSDRSPFTEASQAYDGITGRRVIGSILEYPEAPAVDVPLRRVVDTALPATTEHAAEARNKIANWFGRPAPSSAASPAPPKMPRPNRAVRMGRPMANREPNAIRRMMTAATRPMSSVLPMAPRAVNRSPPAGGFANLKSRFS